MLDVLIPLFLLFVLGYTIHSIVRAGKSSGGRGKSELPVHRYPLSTTSTTSGWMFERQGLTWSLSTGGLNHLPSRILDRRPEGVKRVLRSMYEVGMAAGLLGGLIGMATTIWTTGQVWRAVWSEARSHAAEHTDSGAAVRVLKRALEHPVASPATTLAYPHVDGLQPLIPGISLPWSHLPTLVLALLVNQLIHELGHALSAALEDVTPSSFSLNVHFVMPSMAVHLPASIDYLPARAKMRLAASGPLHNLLIYGWLWVLVMSGMGQLLWTDYNAQGRIVQSVKSNSPLAAHIQPGRLITRLDDVPIGGSDDIWSGYLVGDAIGDQGRGWCMDQNVFVGLPDLPCDPTSGKIRFSVTDDYQESMTKCLHPNPILQIPSARCPCPNSKWVCIRPLAEERVLRIRMKDASYDGEVVLWQGDRRGVMEDIEVGTQGARFAGPFVRWGTMFMGYMSTVALSLFLFNLLPLPYTDGSQLLKALLSLKRHQRTISLRSSSFSNPASSSRRPLTARPARSATINIRLVPDARQSPYDSGDEDGGGGGGGYELERGEAEGNRREEAWKRRLRRSIEGGTMALAAAWVAGWAMLTLLRSS